MLIGIEHAPLPDFLFGALTLVGAFAVVEALRRERPSPRLCAATGAAFALATYVKPVGQVLAPAAAVAVFVAVRSVRASVLPAGATILAALALTSDGSCAIPSSTERRR